MIHIVLFVCDVLLTWLVFISYIWAEYFSMSKSSKIDSALPFSLLYRFRQWCEIKVQMIHFTTFSTAATYTHTPGHTHTCAHMHAFAQESCDQFSTAYIPFQSHTHEIQYSLWEFYKALAQFSNVQFKITLLEGCCFSNIR